MLDVTGGGGVDAGLAQSLRSACSELDRLAAQSPPSPSEHIPAPVVKSHALKKQRRKEQDAE